MTRDEMWLLEEKYQGERSEEFFRDSKRLEEGEPLAYVIGHIPFLNTTIYLDSKPLIPRPETEYWVEKVISDIISTLTPHHGGVTPMMRVLDMCAGSGCIGVAVAQALPTVHVDFVEIENRHHETIKKNLRENGVDTSRTRIFGGNLFEQVTDTYDLILANPPYIDTHLNRTDLSVRAHEPHEALFAEENGLALIRTILEAAPRHLTTAGMLVIEHEPEQVADIRRTALEHGLVSASRPDQYGVVRYTLFTRK